MAIVKTKGAKVSYVCTECGAHAPKWAGQCADCNAWNSMIEELVAPPSGPRHKRAIAAGSLVQAISAIQPVDEARVSTGVSELDRVLGGGLVAGSVVLIGGDPGIGKSTLLLQALAAISKHHKTLYVTGEESLHQVSLRAHRLGLSAAELRLLTEMHIEQIIAHAQNERPQIMVIDSIQTMYTELLQSAPGSVAQVRESAAQLVQFAKATNTSLFLVGHVTKEGTLAGPRVLEHLVDTVLYFEGESSSRYRMIRAVKNRFGAINELGLFAMTEKGLKEVHNPSAIFLSRHDEPVAGSVSMVTWEGSRPILVEVQALVAESHASNPRRVAVGLDQNRLAMLLAVLQRHGGIAMYDQDVFINIAGGVRVTETAADLAIILAALSSLKNKPLPSDLIVFGEVGLAGEIRPVHNGQERLHEAAKHGFKRAIIPHANAPRQADKRIEVFAVKRLIDTFDGL
ncbi:MAG: DNA repair protein RadA/Sm [Gammaproteobacteria bacterium]|nr:MAG: DNA repair protein RadA/Sm [Gammaproteobacteria bacterium]TND07128.1 MAG: DNA repair protein RadA/Sm [Gammaproteobacteria bacterium]